MPRDARKRQKQLERRKAKRKEKRQIVARRQAGGIADRLRAAADAPILHCLAGETLWREGLGQTLLSRELPDGRIAFSVFLIDRYCLGVKNAFTGILLRSEYLDGPYRSITRTDEMAEIAPECLRKLIEGSIAYARSLGLSPHPDYHKAAPLLGRIDAAECPEEFEYGHEGKPLFIAGPHDTAARIHRILQTLETTCGPGGYNYFLPVSPSGRVSLSVEAFDPDESRLE